MDWPGSIRAPRLGSPLTVNGPDGPVTDVTVCGTLPPLVIYSAVWDTAIPAGTLLTVWPSDRANDKRPGCRVEPGPGAVAGQRDGRAGP